MNAQHLLTQEKSSYSHVAPPCPYFGTCGGCTLQDLAYQDQLALKRAHLQRAFATCEGMPPIEVIGVENPWRYRNKAELTFSTSHDGQLILGYHVARSFWKVIDLEDCVILPESVGRLIQTVRRVAAHTGLPAYVMRTHQGFFRYLLVRSSRATGQLSVCLITSPGPREIAERVAQEILEHHPMISSFYWGVTSRIADVAIPEELVLLHGSPYLEDRIGPFHLRLHPLSFLQPINAQADQMYTRLCEFLRQAGEDVAWDLYCGIGVIALYLSRHFRTVYGIDVVAHCRELGMTNAALNGVDQIDVRVGRVETLLGDRRFWLQEAKPEAIAVDPPRAGLHPKAVASIVAARPRRIAYLSCSLPSLLRDLRLLLSSFPRYRLCEVRAFDLFPQTLHVETLVLLERRG